MKLYIVGAGGHGKVCADVAETMGKWDEIAFLDDHPPVAYPYPLEALATHVVDPQADYFVAIGNAQVRRRITGTLLAAGARLTTLIHPQSFVGSRVRIGSGTVIMAGAVVHADAHLGCGMIINTCASVDHDCRLGDYVHVAVGAHVCGTVCIADNSWIGAGAVVKNNVTICADCMIGAGAAVVKDIVQPGTYVGVPARMMKKQ